MTAVLYRLGGLCARGRWIVLIVWAIVAVALFAWAQTKGSNLTDDLSLPGTGSDTASNLLESKFPSQANGTNPVVIRAPAGEKITAAKYQKPIDDTVAALRKNPDVDHVTSPLSSSKGDRLRSSKDDSIAYIALGLSSSPSELTEEDAAALRDEAAPLKAAGLDVSFGGYVGQKLSKPATESSEAVGLTMAVVVLLFTFGTVVAMGLPILTAIFGLVCGLSIITVLSRAVEVPTVAPTLATMIGLGVGIDYALFVVTRHLAQLRGGMELRESIRRSIATSGAAVVFAGCTVIIALLSLAVVGIPLVTTLGYTAATVVVVAVLAAITLLPALLALIGHRIERLRLPLPHAKHGDHPHGWERWARLVARYPWPAMVTALVVLAVLALPVLDLQLGQQDNGAMPKDTESRQAYDGMTRGFGVGSNGQMLIAVDLSQDPAKPDQKNLDKIDQSEQANKDKAKQQASAQEQQLAESLEAQGVPPATAEQQAQAQVQPQLDQQLDKITKQADAKRKQADQPATDPRLQDLRSDLQKTDGVKSVTQPLVNGKGTAAVLTLTPTTAPSDLDTEDLVRRLRDDTIPKATKGTSMTASVGGTTASYVDLADEISEHLLETILIVIALSFVLLTVAFRSLVIPLTAGLMNLISIGAAFGVVTAVFEKGWGVGLVGLDDSVPIVSFVPLMMFAILFGLSMDYEVFLMTHIKEAWERTKDNTAAVVEGIGTTGRVITSAALIMVSVFFAFVLNGDPTVKQFGVGMGVAVAVDATLVRCLLVPAVMVLLGRSNWWLPRWLDRAMPNFSIEDEDWLRRRDEELAAEAAARRERPKAPA
ncbi:MAG TPA: MMPL family transporter [Capillimicrobium sp.]|nr:MMPL family transporter [Capillimicrobium sp.]